MTFIIKTSGDSKALIAAEYECPVHGRFEITVPRDEVADWEHCPYRAVTHMVTHPVTMARVMAGYTCGRKSQWRYPSPACTRVQRTTAARRGKDPERPPNCVDWEALAYDEKPPEEVHAAERAKDWHATRAIVKAGLR